MRKESQYDFVEGEYVVSDPIVDGYKAKLVQEREKLKRQQALVAGTVAMVELLEEQIAKREKPGGR